MTLREKIIQSGNMAALTAFAAGDVENAVVASAPGGIEAQEARGQAALTRKFTQLPKNYLGAEFPIGLLKRLGFTILDDVDDLFVGISAPAGWSLRPTEHSMHSEILDDKGHVRGEVFYKAAFYDRRADFSLRTRYMVETEYEQDDTKTFQDRQTRAVAKDRQDGTILTAGEWERNEDHYATPNGGREKCIAHLDATFPAWRDIDAYW